MREAFPVLACCALLAACGRSTPTGPTKSPALSLTRFLAFGDSMTAGEVTAPVGFGAASPNQRMLILPAASYPTQLLSLLLGRYKAQAASISVTNAGNPGETVLQGAARFPDVFVASQAEVVLLMEGVNGLFLAGPDLSAEVVRGMAQFAKARGARVFIGSMVPTIEGRQRSQVPADLVAYNTRLRQVASDEGAVYVDLYTPLLAEATTVIGVDGLHPTEVGYKRIADVFFAAIQANLEVP